MSNQVVEIEGKKYLRVGDKLAEIDRFDENDKPVLKTWSEETMNPDGSKDCTVHVECLQIASATNK